MVSQKDVRKYAAIISGCDVFISTDGGPLQMALASGTPCVGIFKFEHQENIIYWYNYKERRNLFSLFIKSTENSKRNIDAKNIIQRDRGQVKRALKKVEEALRFTPPPSLPHQGGGNKGKKNMKEIPYKSFSFKRHAHALQEDKASVCQFELTYGCDFHCRHCYTDCYNKPAYLEKELTSAGIKFLLDKIQQAGIVWLCFTGGDPLTRPDFLNIYSYAKQKGFMVTVFTNGYSMTKKMIGCFKEQPPFVIEITLNSVAEHSYESISRMKGSFVKVMEVIKLLLKEKIPLKIKTQITRDNLAEIPQIKKFVEGLGLEFSPSHILYPRLNGDLRPCHLRITPQEVLSLYGLDSRLRRE